MLFTFVVPNTEDADFCSLYTFGQLQNTVPGHRKKNWQEKIIMDQIGFFCVKIKQNWEFAKLVEFQNPRQPNSKPWFTEADTFADMTKICDDMFSFNLM